MSWKSSWKTTLLGLGVASANMFANGTGWKQILISVGLAAMGILAKDYNVSGTTSK